MIHTNCVTEHMAKTTMLPGQIFMAAMRCHLGKADLTLEEQKKACNDLGAYQVHGYIPDYVRSFTES